MITMIALATNIAVQIAARNSPKASSMTPTTIAMMPPISVLADRCDDELTTWHCNPLTAQVHDLTVSRYRS